VKELAGTVREVLPRALYRVRLEDAHEVTAHLIATPRRNFVRIVVGDRVIVELSGNDVRRGRILRRV
jgi:translation initiation factor IF-1